MQGQEDVLNIVYIPGDAMHLYCSIGFQELPAMVGTAALAWPPESK